MNQNPLWKLTLIISVLVITTLYALPNIFGNDPAVQISSAYGHSTQVDEALEIKVTNLLIDHQLQGKSIERQENQLLVRFDNTDIQFKAFAVIKESLKSGYVVAQNLASATPDWLSALGAEPMYLGLDLRGGVHFLLAVDMQTAVKQDEERFVSEFRTLLRKNKVRYKSVRRLPEKGIEIVFKTDAFRIDGVKLVSKNYDQLTVKNSDGADTFIALFNYSEKALKEVKSTAVEQNITTLRNRVNELGVAEPVIQRQGDERIVVQLPGVQDTARAKEILGATATLEFRLVGEKGPNAKEYKRREGGKIWLKRSVIVTGNQINHAASTIDQQSAQPAVSVRLDAKGSKRMFDTTKRNVNKPMAVVFIEYDIKTKIIDGKKVTTRKKKEAVINVANIMEPFGKNFQITGLSNGEANNLSLLLRAGALKAPIEIVEERTIGPSLGADNINKGFYSIVFGFMLVLIFIAIRYRVFGLIANVALVLNVVIVISLLSILQATLTLPGIAGILLTIGMAIDANVLIYERIREEAQNGNTPQASIHTGFERAFGTILDANVTTLIAGIVLFSFGSGAVKGFAVTLSLGIVTSMFTAIMVTRALVNASYGNRRLEKLPI